MRSPHVILEGPDCSGKTTLAQDLVERFGYRYHHEGPPKGQYDVFEYHVNTFLAADRQEQPTVFDRFLVGELVYGPLLRGASKINEGHVYLFSLLRKARGCVSILCYPPYHICYNAWQKRKHLELIKNEVLFKEAYDAYARFKGDHTTRLLKVPRHWVDPVPTLPQGYVGDPLADVLFVGEQSNGNLDLPFMDVSGSSGYLHKVLRTVRQPFAMVNAYNLQGEQNEILAFPRVVALGDVAAQTCHAQGVEHAVQIPHPAYWKRFQSGREPEYFGILKNAVGE